MRISDWSSDVCSSDLCSSPVPFCSLHAGCGHGLGALQTDREAGEIFVGLAAVIGDAIDEAGLLGLEPVGRGRGLGRGLRSEERRVGKECVSQWRYRWSADT